MPPIIDLLAGIVGAWIGAGIAISLGLNGASFWFYGILGTLVMYCLWILGTL